MNLTDKQIETLLKKLNKSVFKDYRMLEKHFDKWEVIRFIDVLEEDYEIVRKK